jgi:hypothetical protein
MKKSYKEITMIEKLCIEELTILNGYGGIKNKEKIHPNKIYKIWEKQCEIIDRLNELDGILTPSLPHDRCQ